VIDWAEQHDIFPTLSIAAAANAQSRIFYCNVSPNKKLPIIKT
jgi:hypothetical protein